MDRNCLNFRFSLADFGFLTREAQSPSLAGGRIRPTSHGMRVTNSSAVRHHRREQIVLDAFQEPPQNH